MLNLLTLYNPYYQKDVIEQHVNILLSQDSQSTATVAFGKIRSKLRDYEHPFEDKLQEIYQSATRENYFQLFLTDYSSVYVAKVIEVVSIGCQDIAPAYYRYKDLDVENWFVISDIRRIVHDDFEQVRDRILGNFTTPNFGDHHYAVYGNSYVYPLVVEMDNEVDYFETDNDEFRYFTEIFKSEKRLETKQALIDYRFGKEVFYSLHPNTQDALISAEIEFLENKDDPLYDFTAIVIHLSKAFEKEIYLFMRSLFIKLIEWDERLGDIEYSVQGRNYRLSDYKNHKPNLGTNKFLLNNQYIKKAINDHIKDFLLRYFIFATISKTINAVQPVRNEAAHGETTSLRECVALRSRIVGIGESGVLCELIGFREVFGEV